MAIIISILSCIKWELNRLFSIVLRLEDLRENWLNSNFHNSFEFLPMINKILVAVDASASANRAVSMASYLASTHDAELLILHVIRDMQLPSPVLEVPEIEAFNDKRDEILRQVADSILKDAEELAKKAGISNIKIAIGSGDPANSIIGYTRRRNIDLVVLGTRGLGKVKGAFLGSVASKVTNSIDLNCMTVK
ncbi:MAG: nucleotide-binding universal stress UspA family protein [Gammaproteobacteria bacterium]|jgi:nucleotide-binding universal stress UspA family protein